MTDNGQPHMSKHLGAFYRREGSHFISGELTRGPWDDRAQHGGPPAALLGRAIEQWGAQAASRHVARITVELLKPIPLGKLEVQVEPIRVGKHVDWLLARLLHEGRELARATAVRMSTADLDLPEPHCPPQAPPAPPSSVAPFVFPFFSTEVAYHRAVDIRIVEGIWGTNGPITAWLGLTASLIEGEATSPFVQMLVLADAQNGVCPALDATQFAFINPDMTVYLRRPMAGSWTGLRARSTPDNAGTGLVQSELYDQSGEVGRVLQSLSIRPQRSGPANS